MTTEKWILALTALVLLTTVSYFLYSKVIAHFYNWENKVRKDLREKKDGE